MAHEGEEGGPPPALPAGDDAHARAHTHEAKSQDERALEDFEKAERAAGPVGLERLRTIQKLIETGQWFGAPTARGLAAQWGIQVRSVMSYAGDVANAIALMRGSHDVVREATKGRFNAIYQSCINGTRGCRHCGSPQIGATEAAALFREAMRAAEMVARIDGVSTHAAATVNVKVSQMQQVVDNPQVTALLKAMGQAARRMGREHAMLFMRLFREELGKLRGGADVVVPVDEKETATS